MAKIIVTDGTPTIENFTVALQAVVNLFGKDYTYRESAKDEYGRCVYALRGSEDYSPRCVVGQALFFMGIEVPSFSEGDPADQVLEELGFQLDEVASLAVNRLQSTQDCGDTWGAAQDEYLDTLAP